MTSKLGGPPELKKGKVYKDLKDSVAMLATLGGKKLTVEMMRKEEGMFTMFNWYNCKTRCLECEQKTKARGVSIPCCAVARLVGKENQYQMYHKGKHFNLSASGRADYFFLSNGYEALWVLNADYHKDEKYFGFVNHHMKTLMIITGHLDSKSSLNVDLMARWEL
jgi:hypothetical protein